MKSIYSVSKRLSQLMRKRDALFNKYSEMNFISIKRMEESIEQHELFLKKLIEDRENSGALNALYFPYSRILDPYSLRKAILLFDKLWFLDSLENAHRNIVLSYRKKNGVGYYPYFKLTEKWQNIQKDYDYLYSNEEIELYDTSEIAHDFAPIIGNNLKNDLEDDEFVDAFKEKCSDNNPCWALLTKDFPWEYTNDYFSVDGSTKIFCGDRTNRFIGIDAHSLIGPIKKLPEEAKFIFVNDAQGASIKISQAIIVSTLENIPLFTDHINYLDIIRFRINSSYEAITKGASLNRGINRDMRAILSSAILDAYLTKDNIAHLPIKKIVQYKANLEEKKIRFNEKLAELCASLENDSYNNDYLQTVVIRYIKPELQKYEDEIVQIYEKTAGKLMNIGYKSLVGVLSGTALTGFVFPKAAINDVLKLSLAIAGAAIIPSVPIILNMLLEKRKQNRNSYAYLMDIRK